jgi:ferredoxin
MSRAHASKRSPVHARQTASPTATGPIHLVVDLNRCQGYAQCCFLAPSVFTLRGEEALWYDPAPDAAEREHVLRAAAACPVQAIHLELSEPASRQRASHKQNEAPHAAQRS